MTIRTKQEKILLDLIKLGSTNITSKQLQELNPEMKLNLIHGYMENLFRRGFLSKPKTINLHSFPICRKTLFSITKDKKKREKIKRILTPELDGVDYKV